MAEGTLELSFAVKWLLEQLIAVLKAGFDAEQDSLAGRVNIIGLVLAAIVALASSVTPWFEAVVRLFQEDYTASVNVLEVLALFAVFVLACVILLGLFESNKR